MVQMALCLVTDRNFNVSHIPGQLKVACRVGLWRLEK